MSPQEHTGRHAYMELDRWKTYRMNTHQLARDLAPLLGDIHGQHDQQLLFSSETQREMLDAFAGLHKPVADVSESYESLRRVESDLTELEHTEQEKLRLLDLWQFQHREIGSLRLQAAMRWSMWPPITASGFPILLRCIAPM